MKMKSPTEPVILSGKSFDWLEDKLVKNQARRKANAYELELSSGAKKLEPQVRNL